MTAASQLSLPSNFGRFEVVEVIPTEGTWRLTKCAVGGARGEFAVVKAPRVATLSAFRSLRQEADIVARLSAPGHAGVVKFLARAEATEPPWYAIEWIDGAILSPAPQPSLNDAIGFVVQLARALAYVHANGVVHGDISPKNILVDPASKRLTLIDFGSAFMAFGSGATREVVHGARRNSGTPGFIAPEQLCGASLDARIDLYSMGCILYEMLTGRPPFWADDASSLARQHLDLPPSPPSAWSPGLPRELDEITLTLLEKTPSRRWMSALDVAQALASVEQSNEARSRAARRLFPGLHPSTLVARDDAVLLLDHELAQAASGCARLVLVCGESGIGKTRLSNEYSRRALRQGFEVVWGQCENLLHTTGSSAMSPVPLGPFRPFLTWLADAQHTDGGERSEELTSALAILADYHEALIPVLEGATRGTTLPPPFARARVLQSLAVSIRAACLRQPLMLVIDDVQWADDLSLAFLCGDHQRLSSPSQLLILATFRSDELPSESRTLLASRAARCLELRRLNSDEVAVLTKDLIGAKVISASVSEFVHRHSAGNPFLAAEYLRMLLDQGALRRSTTDSDLYELSGDYPRANVPAGLKELFELRVAGVSEQARRILELAAVLGARIHEDILVSGTAADMGGDARAGLRELLGRQILTFSGDGHYSFVHDRLREAQRGLLLPARRRELHALAASLLSKTSAFRANTAELGVHFAEAGFPAMALDLLEAAADTAASQYANAEAIELYALALEQLAQISLVDREVRTARDRRVRLKEARGDILFRSGRHEEATQQYADALSAIDEPESLQRSRLERKRAAARWTAHDYEAAQLGLERAERALGLMAEDASPERWHELIEIEQGRFWLQYFGRKVGPLTDKIMRRMTPLVDAHGTSLQRSMFFECAASHIMARNRYLYSPEAVDLARRGVTELGGSSDEGRAGTARFVLAFSLVLGGLRECTEALRLLAENLVELETIGDATLISRTLAYQAIAHRRLGNREATTRLAARARLYAERAGLVWYIGLGAACEAWCHWHDGNLELAERFGRDALAWWLKAPHSFPFQWLANFVLLDVQFVRDDFSTARATLDALLTEEQQRFSEPLCSLLEAAREACGSQEPRSASRSLATALRAAHEQGYC